MKGVSFGLLLTLTLGCGVSESGIAMPGSESAVQPDAAAGSTTPSPRSDTSTAAGPDVNTAAPPDAPSANAAPPDGGSSVARDTAPTPFDGPPVVPDTAPDTTVKAPPDTATVRQAMLVNSRAPLDPSDGLIKARLERAGYQVTVFTVNKPEDVVVARQMALGMNVVVIPSTYNAGGNGGKPLRDLPVGIVCMEQALYADLDLIDTNVSPANGLASGNAITVVNPAHPLAAGAAAGRTLISGDPAMMGWGRPLPSAARVATSPDDANQVMIFGYEKAAHLGQTNAPARRVGLFTAETTIVVLDGAGWAFFDAAVTWASGR